jgi:hypothetical protein
MDVLGITAGTITVTTQQALTPFPTVLTFTTTSPPLPLEPFPPPVPLALGICV